MMKVEDVKKWMKKEKQQDKYREGTEQDQAYFDNEESTTSCVPILKSSFALSLY